MAGVIGVGLAVGHDLVVVGGIGIEVTEGDGVVFDQEIGLDIGTSGAASPDAALAMVSPFSET